MLQGETRGDEIWGLHKLAMNSGPAFPGLCDSAGDLASPHLLNGRDSSDYGQQTNRRPHFPSSICSLALASS